MCLKHLISQGVKTSSSDDIGGEETLTEGLSSLENQAEADKDIVKTDKLGISMDNIFREVQLLSEMGPSSQILQVSELQSSHRSAEV